MAGGTEVRLPVGMRVTDLTGVEWTVRRRWLPRSSLPSLRERLRERRARSAERRGTGDSHWWDVFDVPAVDDSFTAVVLSLAVVALLGLVVVVGLPLLVTLIDLAVLVVATIGAVIARVVFRRPWIVEARSARGDVYELHIVGWRAAGEAVRSLARDLQHGLHPTPDGP